jgi:protein-S-isoprenylcysteine O-methyltransferase Ste14
MFFVVAFGIGLGLHDWRPIRIVSADWDVWRRVVATVLFTGGGAVFAWGLLTLLRAGTGIMLERPASALVARGPYRWSRNPQYVAFAAMYIGLSLAVNSAWPLALLPLVFVLLVVAVVTREERHLRAQFGAAYDDYCRRVGRWL